jgi:polyhydroxyalkanoate synthesis regulator phasin
VYKRQDYLNARNKIIQDMLLSLPIPTSKEMDDLYMEVYTLKKTVRDLEKAKGKT